MNARWLLFFHHHHTPMHDHYELSFISPQVILMGMLISTLSMQMPDTKRDLWSAVHITGMLTHADLDEVSGIELSTSAPLLWAHNDSGDSPRLFLLSERGDLEKEVRLLGIQPFDAEDLSRGPCSPSAKSSSCLFLGDVGDNRHRRAFVEIHRIPEPDLSQALPSSLQPDLSIQLVHPDNEAHDTEAVMSHPITGELYLMEKSRRGTSRLLKVPHRAFTHPEETHMLSVAGTTTITHANRSGRLVTSGTFTRDGMCIIVRTYLEVLSYCRHRQDETWQEALDRAPGRFIPPGMIQSEAIAIDPRNGALWITSERLFSPLLYLNPQDNHDVLQEEGK